jgi:hypothetical protein
MDLYTCERHYNDLRRTVKESLTCPSPHAILRTHTRFARPMRPTLLQKLHSKAPYSTALSLLALVMITLALAYQFRLPVTLECWFYSLLTAIGLPDVS